MTIEVAELPKGRLQNIRRLHTVYSGIPAGLERATENMTMDLQNVRHVLKSLLNTANKVQAIKTISPAIQIDYYRVMKATVE